MAYSTRSFGFGGMLTPVVKRLLIANVAVFAVMLLPGAGRLAVDWFAFQPTRIFIRPWGVFTYMFIHGGLMHVAMNMLFLFFFGPPLESRWGGREFFKFYVICGLGGVALSYLFLFLQPVNVIGASAAIYGVMLAFAMNWPDAPVYVFGIFPVKAKWLVAFFFVVSLLNAFGSAGGGIAHFAHLGGIVTGFIYLKSDLRGGKRVKHVAQAVRTRRLAIVPRAERDEHVGAGKASGRQERKEEQALYDAVDRVLDKISAQGMSSLTPDELKLLDEVSKRHRAN
jgi:membrane associated rhomboid family serine protease